MTKSAVLAMFLFSTIMGTTVPVQDAEACGIKTPAKIPKMSRATASKNPSTVLVVGERDSSLIRQLKLARHKVVYAKNVETAKPGNYKIVIADGAQYDNAQDAFANSQVLRASRSGTARKVEAVLARRATQTKRTRVATATNARKPTEARLEGKEATRKPVDSKIETTTTPTPAEVKPPAPKEPVVAPVVEPAPEPKDDPKARNTGKVRSEPRNRTTEPREAREPKVAASGKWFSSMYFRTNSTELSSAAERRLRSNAKWLEKNPGATLTIEGHTDSVGEASYNMDLSERRANFGVEFLVGIGVDRSRITVVPRGEEAPAHQPSTSARNRRIVLIKN